MELDGPPVPVALVPLVGPLPVVPLAQLVERIGSDARPAACRVTPQAFVSLVDLVAARRISRDSGREVLSRLVAEGGDPAEIVEREAAAPPAAR